LRSNTLDRWEAADESCTLAQPAGGAPMFALPGIAGVSREAVTEALVHDDPRAILRS